jgi:hypothetical protein
MMGALLHFQDVLFLADYAAMQHKPEATSTGSPDRETTASVPVSVDQKSGRVASSSPPVEIGGPKGPEPTRFGDWEKAGRCIDF